MKTRFRFTPGLIIAFVYVSVASAWILFSDTALGILVGNGTLYIQIQSIKGLIFVVFSGLVIYYSVERQFASLRRAETALRHSEERFRVALKDSPIVVFNHDLNLRYTWIYNPKLGLSADSVLGKTDAELLSNDFGAALVAIKRRVIETGQGSRQEVEIPAGGAISHFDLIVEPLYDTTGSVIGVTCATIDITEFKRTQTELAKSEERYRLVALAANEIIWSWDKIPDVVEWNDGLRTILGYDPQNPDTHRYKWWLDRIHPDDLEGVVSHLSNFEEKQIDISNLEYRFRRSDGAYAYVVDRVYSIYDQQGQIIRQVGAIQDITEKRVAEAEILRLNAELEQRVIRRTEQLEAANKELEAFSYSVSHDLRAPLRAVDGFSRILLEEYSTQLDDEGRRYLGLIRTNAQQMGQLIDDLLTFSRFSRQPLKRTPVDLSEISRSIFDELISQEQSRSIELKLSPVAVVQVDLVLIRQVFTNLISNALKFTRNCQHAIIEIGMNNLEGENVYYVRDNGVGFDPRYTHKLFNVFQRLHRAEDFEGTGVGLAIVHRIIARHGGRVWAESDVGQGAKFSFTLPENADKVITSNE